jgi:DNA-binding LacI/PurR family transcriptional regulator
MTIEITEKKEEKLSLVNHDPYFTLQDHARTQIENLINDLQLTPGDRLPSVRELSTTLNVSRATAGNAITRMIDDGLLISQPQKGVYLNMPSSELCVKRLEVVYCLVESGTKPDRSLARSPLGYLEHNPFWHSLMNGIRNIAGDISDIRLRLSFLEDFLAEADVTPRGRDWSRVGFIILGDPHKKFLPPLIKLNAPIVLANGITRSPHISNTNIDCALGVEKLVDHLAKLNHRKIAYCGTLQRQHQYNYRKFIGFKRAMRKYSFDIQDKYCRKCYFSMEDGYNAAKSLLTLPDRPTAILFMNDESAIGAMRAIIDAGLSVPGDISVAGFDNIVSCNFTNPSLTTVSSRMIEMGELSMKKLIEIYKTKENHTVSLTPEIIIRESTAQALA